MNSAMTTTAFALDGYRVVKSLGVVRGIIVRSRSIFGTIGAGLQTLVGGNISIFTDLCEQTRQRRARANAGTCARPRCERRDRFAL